MILPFGGRDFLSVSRDDLPASFIHPLRRVPIIFSLILLSRSLPTIFRWQGRARGTDRPSRMPIVTV